MQEKALYEQKILNDDEFPVQLHINDIKQPGYYFNSHWHEHIELHYILEGSTIFKLNQKEVWGQKGSLVVINSNELHSGYCGGESVKALVVIFEMEDFSKELAGRNIILESLIQNDPIISDIMRTISAENENRNLGYRLRCKGAIMYLITHLVRNYAAQILSDYDSAKRLKSLERLNTVISYIHDHYMEQISNQELSDLIHLSEGRFNHLFRENMNMPPLQYINTVRLKKAMSLLKQKEYTISEVALAVGFTDYNHFGRLFRRYYGHTPSEALKH